MNRKSMASMAVVVCLGIALMVPFDTLAQSMRTLEIRDGVVRIDGKEVPKNSLPESLETKDISLNFAWAGISEPVIEIDGRYYMLDADGLHEAEGNVAVDGARAQFFDALGSVEEGTWYSSGMADPATRRQMEALQGQAREMNEISKQLERRRAKDTDQLADEIRKQAEMSAAMAAELPRLNVATYWEAVRQNDEGLYKQLVDEWNLESEIQALSAEVRSKEKGQVRDELVAQLRARLGQAFELKQDNRRREVDQLESELETLQTRLKERESLRDKIIDRRLRELIGK
ncbi:MAG: hypothetical protein HKN37_17735 [Rhodothermales bacterium]|nr:hypothetical protein [Rhodothermales bacterium]